MKKLVTVLVVLVALAVILLFMGPFYIVQEGYQAVIVRFGQIMRIETEAGLKLKTPFLDNIVMYPKKYSHGMAKPSGFLQKKTSSSGWIPQHAGEFQTLSSSMNRCQQWKALTASLTM